MDIHDIDDYLDLQDQHQLSLLSTEDIAPQPEWSQPNTDMNSFLFGHDDQTSWSNLPIQDADTSQENHYITPDLLKQPESPPVPVLEERRITRSRAGSNSGQQQQATVQKTRSSKKKLYCICQQPYNGKPMVQCDDCEEWFHCTCVDFNPDEQEEDIDWVCQTCIEAKGNTKEPSPAPINTRQTRGASARSKCLYAGCQNRTRMDSYCSDVCARKSSESTTKKPSRISTMRKETPKRTSKAKQQEDDFEQEQEVEKEDDQDFNDDEEKEEEEQSPNEGSKTPDTPLSPTQQMPAEDHPVRRNVIKNISKILETIISTSTDSDLFSDTLSAEERSQVLAKSIERTMLEQLGRCGEPYKSKFRSLLYNLKDKQNHVFQLRLITGDLTPLELVKMSSEDMANPELKSKSEVLRKLSLKNSVMKLDNTPIIKKTHKGDIIMEAPKQDENQSTLYAQQVEEKKDVAAENTSSTNFSRTTKQDREMVDPLDDILSGVGIPYASTAAVVSNNIKKEGTVQQQPGDTNNKRGAEAVLSSISAEATETKKRKVSTVDLEALLGEEEEEFKVDEVELTQKELEVEEEVKKETTPPPQEEKTSIWQGNVKMPQVAEFEATARQIGGRTLTTEEWNQVLSPTMWIEGRINTQSVTSYVTQSQYSTNREIVLLEIEPSQDTKASQTLLHYLDSRQRYAVVGHNKRKVKDFYLIPLYKTQQIPDCLYVVRVEETKREVDFFLGVLVLSKDVVPESSNGSAAAPVQAQSYTMPTNSAYIPLRTASSSYNYPASSDSYQRPSTTSYSNYTPSYGYGYQAQQQQQAARQPEQKQGYHQHQHQDSRQYHRKGSDSYRPNY